MSKNFPRWREHSIDERDNLEISRNFKPWTTRPDVKLKGVRVTPRVLELIDIAWAYRLAAADGSLEDMQLREGYFADVSQAVERHPFGDMSSLASGPLLSY